MNLYPRLPLATATALSEEIARLSRSELLERSSDWDPSVILAPVGGASVDRNEVRRLQSLIRARAHDASTRAGSDEAARRFFDQEVSRLLFDEMDLAPHEAAQAGVWSFLTCIVVPDVVRWRFPGDDGTGTPVRRFTGGARGVRNALGRLWWRAYVLHEPEADDPWRLVRVIGEDQAVAILERPFLSGHPPLAREVLRAVTDSGGQQQELMRDLTKRLLRVGGALPLEALAPDVTRDLVHRELSRSQAALSSTAPDVNAGITPPEPPATGAAPSASAAAPVDVVSAESPPRDAEARRGTVSPVFTARLAPAQLRPGPWQGVVVLPDEMEPMLPSLNEAFVNPDRSVIAIDELGQRWLWRYMHYNRLDSSRQLAGLTDYLVRHRAVVGDQLRIRPSTDGIIQVVIVHAADPDPSKH